MKKNVSGDAEVTRTKRFQLKSIQSKVALLLTVCVLLSSAIVGTIFISEISGILHDEAVDSVIRTSAANAKSINDKLDKIEEQVKTMQHYAENALANSTLLETPEGYAQFLNDFKTIATNHARSAEGIIGVFSVFDPQALSSNGELGFSYKADAHGHFSVDETTNLSIAANAPLWYRTPVTAGKPLWLEVAPQEANGQAMAFVAPILKPNGTCVGIVGVSCDTEILVSAAKSLRIFETGYAFLLNTDGSVLYHPKMLFSPVTANHPEFEALTTEPESVTESTELYTYRNKSERCFLSRISLRNGKQFLITVPQNELYEESTSLVTSSILILIGVVLASLLTAVLFSRRLTRPITRLNTAAREMLAGNLDTELRPTTIDEIGELTSILNRARERIRYQISGLYNEAHNDGLTGIPNKNAFSEEEHSIDRNIEYGYDTHFVVAVLDVNRLKVTNDYFGHAAGDALLKTVANHLKAGVGAECVFRMGGDEFAILLKGNNTKENVAIIERCVATLSTLHVQEFPDVTVSCAVGITAYDAETDTHFRDALQRADRLMYQNKGQSKREAEKIEGAKGIKQLQIDKFLEFLSVLNASTDDYSFLYEMENDKAHFFGKLFERYTISLGPDGTLTLSQMIEAIHPADRAAFLADVKHLADGEEANQDANYRLLTSDGAYVWISCRGRLIKTEDGQPFVLIGRLSDTALRPWYNSITGLFNRNRFVRDMQKLEGTSYQGFMLLDIDNMSNINLNLGRNTGDECLRILAKQLEASFPEAPIYHMEKDRFAVLLATYTEDELAERFASLSSALSTNFSVSATVTPCDDTLYLDPNSIYEYANQLLKEHKGQKSGTISFFSREDLLKRISSITLLNELRQSVANGFEGFYVVYQPQVAANGYTVLGAEALLRYRSPSRGVISPAEFIPILERTRMISQVGLFVCDTALAQCRAWRESNPNFRMAVNFSSIQLQEDKTAEEVLALLEKHGLPGDALTVELTESIQLDDTEIDKMFDRFRAAGIRIAIDDFGTGYANLAYLKQIHADEIKIDRIFIKDIRLSTYNYMVISNILEFAHENGFHVCLEGVETAEELSVLENLNAHTLQGFLFDKPLSVEEFSERYMQTDLPQWSFVEELIRHKEQAELIRFDTKAILSNIHIGLWIIRIDEANGTAKLFGDAVMHELLGIDATATPEECYKHWYSRIPEEHVDAVNAMVTAMKESGKICQSLYPWRHPVHGEIVVRCTGRCIKNENGVIAFEGFHRRITDAQNVYTHLSEKAPQ